MAQAIPIFFAESAKNHITQWLAIRAAIYGRGHLPSHFHPIWHKKMLNVISATTKAFFFSIGPTQLIENRVWMELLKKMARKIALHIAIFWSNDTIHGHFFGNG